MIDTSFKQSWPHVYSCSKEQHVLFIVSTAEEQHIEATMCIYCRQTPCMTTDSWEHLGFRATHVQNHVRRRKDYKTYWRALKKCGLWKDPVYLARKLELGDRIDVVVKDVRARFPNPPGIPYMGHKREWERSFLASPFLGAFILKYILKSPKRVCQGPNEVYFIRVWSHFFGPQFWSLTPESQILDTN